MDNLPFKELDVRINNSLLAMGITTDEQLKLFVLKSPREIMNVRNFGKVCYQKLLYYAKKRGWTVYSKQMDDKKQSISNAILLATNLVSLQQLTFHPKIKSLLHQLELTVSEVILEDSKIVSEQYNSNHFRYEDLERIQALIGKTIRVVKIENNSPIFEIVQ